MLFTQTNTRRGTKWNTRRYTEYKKEDISQQKNDDTQKNKITYPESSITKGFEKELTTKQTFYILLYQLCPLIHIVDIFWNSYINHRDKDILDYYIRISPFRPHPCGSDSIFHKIAGFIDHDMFLYYYQSRETYLCCIKIIGNSDYICKFLRPKYYLEDCHNYFDLLLNEGRIKLLPLQKTKVLERVIIYLSTVKYNLTIEQVIRYIYSCYKMYKNIKILHAYPIAIDSNNELCRFE